MALFFRRPLIALLTGVVGMVIGSAASAAPADTAAPTTKEDVSATDTAPPIALAVDEPPAQPAAADAAGVPTEAAVAAPAEASSGWRFSIIPYVWMPATNGTVGFKAPAPASASASVDFHVPFIDFLSALRFGIMGAGELRDDRFSIFTDMIYANVGFPGSAMQEVSGPRENTVTVTGSATFIEKAFIWTGAGGYDIVHSDRLNISLFGGFRFLGVDGKLGWSVTGPLGNFGVGGQFGSYNGLMDGIGGVRGDVRLGDSRWKFDFYGDAGAGGSNFTYQLLGQFAYTMKWGQIALGWRYLNYQQPSDKFLQNMSMSGPIISAVYRFGS